MAKLVQENTRKIKSGQCKENFKAIQDNWDRAFGKEKKEGKKKCVK